MKLPKKSMMQLQIGAYSVPVYHCPEILKDRYEGFTECGATPVILLARDKEEEYISTLLHEAIHVIDSQADLNLSERTTRVLEHQLLALLVKNPVFHDMGRFKNRLNSSNVREVELL